MGDHERLGASDEAPQGVSAGAEQHRVVQESIQEVDEFGLPLKKYVVNEDADGGTRNGDISDNPEHNSPTANGAQPIVSDAAAAPSKGSKAQEIPVSREGELDITSLKLGEQTNGEGGRAQSPVREDGHSAQTSTVNSAQTPAVDAEEAASKDAHLTGNKVRANSGTVGHGRVSEWSHQQFVTQGDEEDEDDGDDNEVWQEMPAFAPYDIYDDDGKLIAREAQEMDEETIAYASLGGAGKGYTKVNMDDDAQSATSMDENTKYLFKESGTNVADEDDPRDALSQMQATKDLLTEGQRVAYVGLTRVHMVSMIKEVEDLEGPKTPKEIRVAVEAMKMWSQKMIVRLYAHMEINPSEQVMIEQLAEHGVQPSDLAPSLMVNSRVKNPMAEQGADESSSASQKSGSSTSGDSPSSPTESALKGEPEVQSPSQLPTSKDLDIDLRWTVLCDLFLILIADSVYDARSRALLERVGSSLDVPWLDICRFEKRVTDALEMQEAASKENWNEDEHMENRRKLAFKRKIMMMGLATVGGSLVIGLSAGLLAPVIGAGLAAGFTTIGVAGTSGFLAGAGGAALVTTTGAVSGATIALRASHRRTGAVKTFEYRPLHNNKRTNLIITVSGWMTGKIDDVRLPYSTVDPIMGDIYSVLWEPEMLRSMGETINILATEALTQGLQQVLGSTILIGLMASLQLPVMLTKLSYLIDNPWTVSLDRANAAGLILADSLIDRNLGVRPITLVGFSLGARVIFSCLRELANKGAFGIVQNVYLFGSPIVAKKDEYLRARSVVSGRFVNGYAKNDWILGYLFRATSGGIMRVAGLGPVEGIPGLENIDVTALVNGHMAYRSSMPRLLREVGWIVDSDEFAEIEDPDPENHETRQRELISEIEAARRELEKKPEKKKFGLFSRKKNAERKGWETYNEANAARANDNNRTGSSDVLFDVDAIRAELASEQIEVKQLESTLPPMKLDSTPTGSYYATVSPVPKPLLRETKSHDIRIDGLNRSNPAATASLPSLKATHSSASLDRDDSKERARMMYGPEKNGNTYLEPDDGVQMTFDTAYSSPALSAHRSASVEPTSRLNLAEHDTPVRAVSGSERPVLQHAATVTNPLGISLEHNAWADEDDEFGKEKELEMTFE